MLLKAHCQPHTICFSFFFIYLFLFKRYKCFNSGSTTKELWIHSVCDRGVKRAFYPHRTTIELVLKLKTVKIKHHSIQSTQTSTSLLLLLVLVLMMMTTTTTSTTTTATTVFSTQPRLLASFSHALFSCTLT